MRNNDYNSSINNSEWEISVDDTSAMISGQSERTFLLDVREPAEHRICHLPGACLVPMADLPLKIDDIREMAEGKQVIVYCHHGIRSLSAAAFLRQAGIEPVRSMAGGIDLWSLKIDPGLPRY